MTAKTIAPGVTIDPEVMSGTPCIAGTRLPTGCIARIFPTGRSVRWIAQAYYLKTRQVEAAIRYEFNLKLSGKRRPRARRTA